MPDQTWFVKGIIHDNYSSTDYILRKFSETNGKFTVNDDPNWPQFMVVDQETKSDDVPKVIPMTKDNCNLGMHYSDGADTNQKGFLATFFDTLFGWVRSLINMVKELFSKITIKK